MQALESLELQSWLKKIESFHPQEIDMGLERIAKIEYSLDCLHFSCPVISVAGTNGKGSCVELLSAFAHGHGLKVATYTSPHLFRFNERIRINGIQVDDGELIENFIKIEKAINEHSGAISLSFFEYTTLAALLVFKKQQPDVIVLEVGLGGRLDAVNIIDADVSVITSIGLDHEAWLGNTREQVAIEKAGIARANSPVVVGDVNPPENLEKYLQALKARCFFRNRHFSLKESTNDNLVFEVVLPACEEKLSIELNKNNLFLSPENILTSLQAFACISQSLSLDVDQSVLAKACCETQLTARFQIIEFSGEADTTIGPNRVILDLTHNPAGAVFFRQQLDKFEKSNRLGKVAAVFGVMKDKDIQGILEQFIDRVDFWLFCTLDSERSARADELEALIKSMKVDANVKCFDSVEQAMSMVFDENQDVSSLLVFGSFFSVGPAMRFMQNKMLL